MSIYSRFFGKIDTKLEIKKIPPVPKDYLGMYPLPPHVSVEQKNDTIKYLRTHLREGELSVKEKIRYFLGSKFLQNVIEFIYWSCHIIKFKIHPKTQELIENPKGQFIMALWHNRLFFTVFSLRYRVANHGHDVLAIISESGDAELIARATEKWGAFCARGSSTRGGIKATKKILKAVKHHFHPLITPDGPMGPVYVVKDGLPMLAKLTGLPIVPMCYDAQNKWVFKSWDSFIIPKPFSKVVLEYGEPIIIDKKDDIEESCRVIEEKMLKQVKELAEEVRDSKKKKFYLQDLLLEKADIQISLHTKEDASKHYDIFILFHCFDHADNEEKVLLTMQSKYISDISEHDDWKVQRILNHRKLYFNHSGEITQNRGNLEKIRRYINNNVNLFSKAATEFTAENEIYFSEDTIYIREEMLRKFLEELNHNAKENWFLLILQNIKSIAASSGKNIIKQFSKEKVKSRYTNFKEKLFTKGKDIYTNIKKLQFKDLKKILVRITNEPLTKKQGYFYKIVHFTTACLVSFILVLFAYSLREKLFAGLNYNDEFDYVRIARLVAIDDYHPYQSEFDLWPNPDTGSTNYFPKDRIAPNGRVNWFGWRFPMIFGVGYMMKLAMFLKVENPYTQEWVTSFPLLCSLLSIFFLFWMGYIISGIRAGFFISVLYAILGYDIQYSTMVLTEPVVNAILILSCFFFVSAMYLHRKTHQVSRLFSLCFFIISGIFCFLLFYIKPFAVVFAAGAITAILFFEFANIKRPAIKIIMALFITAVLMFLFGKWDNSQGLSRLVYLPLFIFFTSLIIKFYFKKWNSYSNFKKSFIKLLSHKDISFASFQTWTKSFLMPLTYKNFDKDEKEVKHYYLSAEILQEKRTTRIFPSLSVNGMHPLPAVIMLLFLFFFIFVFKLSGLILLSGVLTLVLIYSIKVNNNYVKSLVIAFFQITFFTALYFVLASYIIRISPEFNDGYILPQIDYRLFSRFKYRIQSFDPSALQLFSNDFLIKVIPLAIIAFAILYSVLISFGMSLSLFAFLLGLFICFYWVESWSFSESKEWLAYLKINKLVLYTDAAPPIGAFFYPELESKTLVDHFRYYANILSKSSYLAPYFFLSLVGMGSLFFNSLEKRKSDFSVIVFFVVSFLVLFVFLEMGFSQFSELKLIYKEHRYLTILTPFLCIFSGLFISKKTSKLGLVVSIVFILFLYSWMEKI